MPVETFADRFFVALIVIGAPAAMFGMILVGFSIVGVVRVVRAHGLSSRSGTIALTTLFLGLVASAVFMREMSRIKSR